MGEIRLMRLRSEKVGPTPNILNKFPKPDPNNTSSLQQKQFAQNRPQKIEKWPKIELNSLLGKHFFKTFLVKFYKNELNSIEIQHIITFLMKYRTT